MEDVNVKFVFSTKNKSCHEAYCLVPEDLFMDDSENAVEEYLLTIFKGSGAVRIVEWHKVAD